MKNSILHKAETRGHADHGWLDAYHSFSFANYHNPERMNFGVLRVLNDDTIDKEMGFGTHPHKNMEIITILLEGDLQHKDNMGNSSIIKQGDIQVMSAGSGIQHSEFNPNPNEITKLLQIWIIPNKNNVVPRYEQITLNEADRKNKLQQILSPNTNDEGVWIHQQAWFHLGNLDEDIEIDYSLKQKSNGVYLFLLQGEIEIGKYGETEKQQLNTRDGIGIWEVEKIKIKTHSYAELLVMEVPLN